MIVTRERLQALGDRLAMDRAGRAARVEAAIAAYENARSDGLCDEGAWECAREAMCGGSGEAHLEQG